MTLIKLCSGSAGSKGLQGEAWHIPMGPDGLTSAWNCREPASGQQEKNVSVSPLDFLRKQPQTHKLQFLST